HLIAIGTTPRFPTLVAKENEKNRLPMNKKMPSKKTITHWKKGFCPKSLHKTKLHEKNRWTSSTVKSIQRQPTKIPRVMMAPLRPQKMENKKKEPLLVAEIPKKKLLSSTRHEKQKRFLKKV